ncbi:MAG: collagen-like protein [Prevotella sp.]|jgi:hypothetical protein|nr:hypothetical protein [Prevotella sp.]MCH4182985.1 collagen-like protein [Prevotella sp.]
MEQFEFNPTTGYNDASSFPDPGTESETREQIQNLHDQTRDYINNVLLTGITGTSGAANIGTASGQTVQAALDGKPDSSNIKAIRLNDDNAIETSADGTTFSPSASSGHIIVDQYGALYPQRTRLKFTKSNISDDGTNTIIEGIIGATGPTGATGPQGVQGEQGIQGATGPQGEQGVQGPTGATGADGTNGRDGNSFVVRGRFNTYAELTTVYPSGEVGWAYAVGTAESNVVYNWDVETSQWVSLGKLQGPTGPQGPQGETGATGAQGIQGIQGPQGIQGTEGAQGPQGEVGATGAVGPGVVSGGTADQLLAKNSATNYDTKWINPSDLPISTATQTALDTTNNQVTLNKQSIAANATDITTLETYEMKYVDAVPITVANIASNATYTSLPYRSTLQTWTGLTSFYKPDASIAPDNAYTDSYAIETATDGFYVYFASMPTATVMFDTIWMQKGVNA